MVAPGPDWQEKTQNVFNREGQSGGTGRRAGAPGRRWPRPGGVGRRTHLLLALSTQLTPLFPRKQLSVSENFVKTDS